MSSSRSPDFDKSNASFNSTLNDGYTTADENVTRYYSTFEVTDSTIEADNSEIIDSPCTMDEKQEIVQDATLGHNDNAECATEPNANDSEIKLTTSMHVGNADNTTENIDEALKEGIKSDESPINVVNNIEQVNDIKVEENALDEQDKTITDVKLQDIVLGQTDQICKTADGNVLLYKIEISVKEDSEQCKESNQSNKGKLKSKEEQVNQDNKSEVRKETENGENYVEEYLDEEYLEYETVEGEPVTGDSNPNDTIMTPSDSDDDASDNSPVMAYLEKNENLNFYKNNPHATGLPKRSPEKSKRNLQNQIAPITNGLTSVLLKSSDMPVIRYKKIVTGKPSSEPKYALIKETTLHSGIPRAKKLSFGSTASNNVIVEIDSKNEIVPTVKKPRERKQVLEPANVDVVFELEKVKKEEEEEANRKSRKKTTKINKPGSVNKDVYNPSKVKRKGSKKKETTKEESPTAPPRQSTRLRKSNKKKKCAIASCKCDLDHEEEQSEDESEADSNKYENTSDYSDEWQLSPKSVSLTSQPKVKVYSNLRKRQHSHKSTFDDDEDDLSNDLLTLIKEDEKSNKEIDLNKEFPDKSATVISPLKKTKLDTPESEELITKVEEKVNDSILSIIHDDASLFSTSMTLVKSEDEEVEEFEGFEPLSNIVPTRKSAPLNAFVSIFNSPASDEIIVEEIQEIEPSTSANTNSVKKDTANLNKVDLNKQEKHMCSICNKMFPLKVHLIVHEKNHKVTSTCRYCSENFTYPTALKEHVKKNCSRIKEDEKSGYLEELNKKKIVPAITRSKGIPLRSNTPRRMKLLRKTPLNSKVKPTSIPMGGARSKLTKTPLKSILVPKNTSKQINNIDKQNVRVLRKPAVQRYSTMKRRSQNVLQEINKPNNNLAEPATSSQTTAESPFKCDECKLDFKTQITLQRHKSTHKNTFKCSKCNTEFRNQMLLSKHVSSCQQSTTERSTRRTMHVATLNQILSSSQKNKEKTVPLRKLRAHAGVPLSSKMQKVLEKIKKGDIKNINNAT